MAEIRNDETGERTHEPTAMRLAEARRRGQVPRSADLTAAAAGIAILLVLAFGGSGLLKGMAAMTAELLDGRGQAKAWVNPAADDVGSAVASATAGTIARAAGLLALVAGLVAVAAFAQVGPVAASERVTADWSRISPSDGWRRLMSSRTLVRVLLGAGKVAVAGSVAWFSARPMVGRIAASPRLDAWSLAGEAGQMVLTVTLRVAVCLVLLGLADWLYQRWQHRRDLRMTRSEWREDMKRAEGDPAVKRRRRKRVDEMKSKAERRSEADCGLAATTVVED